MSIKSFFKFVEIQTKIASMVPFIIGTLFAAYRYEVLKVNNIILFFFSVLALDMATTGINNLSDHRHSKLTSGFNYASHNAIGAKLIKEKTAFLLIVILLMVGAVFGLILFMQTDIIVLFIGLGAFAIGILYSAGPLPISRTPLGEVFSGLFMGGLIFFVAVYINIYDQSFIVLTLSDGILNFQLDVLEAINLLLVSLPLIIGIGNIMLANNLCDMQDDEVNGRHTLPLVVGKKKSLLIFNSGYYFSMMIIVLSSILNIIPRLTLILLPLFFVVLKNLKIFYHEQSKEHTFVIAVKNFMIFAVVLILPFLIQLMLFS